MPETTVFFYQEEDESVPLDLWLEKLPVKARDKCLVRLGRLEEQGHELRRPEADYLRDGIYELRTRHQNVNYRMLYFFYGDQAAVLSHGLTKERRVPPREIDLAVERKNKVQTHPARHLFTWEH